MAVLPVDSFGLGAVTQSEDEPSLTWFIDKTTNRIRGTCDGYAAVKQAVEIILNTVRFKWQIYSSSSGVDYDNLIGLDVGYVSIELQRRLKDALMMDSRITGISDFSYTISGENLTASFIVNTVYGDVEESLEVNAA